MNNEEALRCLFTVAHEACSGPIVTLRGTLLEDEDNFEYVERMYEQVRQALAKEDGMMKVCEVRGCRTTANGGGRFCDMHSSCPLVTLTPEQIMAAHDALSAMSKNSYLSDRESMSHVVRAALPPPPEPRGPRITPAEKLASDVFNDTSWDEIGPREAGIRAARAEILAWWENKVIRCETCVNLMRMLREEDGP